MSMIAHATESPERPVLPPAAAPLFRLVRHHYRLRTQPGLAYGRDAVELAESRGRDQTPLVICLGLLLDEVLADLIEPPSPSTLISVNERLALRLGALEDIIRTTWPLDAVAPHLSNQAHRMCVLPAPLARALIQSVLAVVLTAVAVEATMIVVSMPRAENGGVLVTIEADAMGFDDAQHAEIKGHIVAELVQFGGTLADTGTTNDTHLARIWVPNRMSGAAHDA